MHKNDDSKGRFKEMLSIKCFALLIKLTAYKYINSLTFKRISLQKIGLKIFMYRNQEFPIKFYDIIPTLTSPFLADIVYHILLRHTCIGRFMLEI